MSEITRPGELAVNHDGRLATRRLLPVWLNLLAATLLLSLTLGFVLTAPSGLSQLRYPAESAGRLSDRHWNFYEGYETTGSLDQAWHRLLFGPRSEVEAQNLELLREVIEYFRANPAAATSWAELNARARLLIGLAEAARWDELNAELAGLGPTPEEDTLGSAVRFAYGLPGDGASRGEIIAGLNFMPLGWAADRLALRIAERSGNLRAATRIGAELRAEGARLRLWNNLLGCASFTLILAGLVLWLRGAVRPLAGMQRPDWSFAAGLEVIVWSALAAVAVGLLLQISGGSYFRPGPAAAWAALIAGLPMLWLVHRRLLRPQGLPLAASFGLLPRRAALRPLLAASLALFALERGGSILIAWLGARFGQVAHWSQGLYEPLLFGPDRTVWLAAVSLLLWAPLIEEIAFRGLLYNTLAQRWRPLTATAISALAFAALHLYAWTAFLSVLWTGLVLAWGYQRCGSLLPGILAHALANAFALLILVQFYR